MKAPIPAFYCCYLLRSSVKRDALYVGSTPHIVRRWKQHNGIALGGAVRTSRYNQRPWDVVCIVHGFPSSVAALQFEWAWQKTRKTRHVGIAQKAAVKCPTSLPNRISNLHILLRSKSFERWPLSLRFFDVQAYQLWTAWCERMSEAIRPGIKAVLDPLATDSSASQPGTIEPPTDLQISKLPVPPALAALDLGYTSFKPHAEKAKSLLGSSQPVSCSVCKSQVDKSQDLTLVCPHGDCTAVSHLSCLSGHFIRANPDEIQIMPLDGNCPKCNTQTSWATLSKELSLRTRGQPILYKLFKPPRGKKAKDDAALQSGALSSTQQEQDDDDIDAALLEQDDLSFQQFEDTDTLPYLGDVTGAGPDDDHVPPSAQLQGSMWTSPVKTELVIQDSDWEDAEIVD